MLNLSSQPARTGSLNKAFLFFVLTLPGLQVIFPICAPNIYIMSCCIMLCCYVMLFM